MKIPAFKKSATQEDDHNLTMIMRLPSARTEKVKKFVWTFKWQIVATATAIVCMGGAVGTMAYRTSEVDRLSRISASAAILDSEAVHIRKVAGRAAYGDVASFNEMGSTGEEISTTLKSLPQHDSVFASSISSGLEGRVAIVLGARKSLSGFGDRINVIRKDAMLLRAVSDQLLSVFIQAHASQDVIDEANRLADLVENLGPVTEKISRVDSGTVFTDTVIDAKRNELTLDLLIELKGNIAAIGVAIKQIPVNQGGAEAAYLVNEIGKFHAGIDTEFGSISPNIQTIASAIDATHDVSIKADALADEAKNISERCRVAVDSLSMLLYIASALALVGVAAIGMIFMLNAREDRRKAKIATEEKDAIDRSVLNMIGELAKISSGDLLSRATVSEDVTGVIADSINVTVEELANLVKQVNKSADSVVTMTESLIKTIDGVNDVSAKQKDQVDWANNAVGVLTDSIRDIRDSATASAAVANEALEAADNGHDRVLATVNGMGAIRENIQETSKRIKRLGETSQEIGEIADLVSDITEKTNVLALNAFLQSEIAGEHGRGFRVIANEIQNLAEQSYESLSRVNALIQSIQSDTGEAIAAMERSTSGVVDGAAKADEAGAALERIRDTSKRLSELISNISALTSSQNEQASIVSESMEQILKVSAGSADVAASARRTAGVMEATVLNLKSSVSNFVV